MMWGLLSTINNGHCPWAVLRICKDCKSIDLQTALYNLILPGQWRLEPPISHHLHFTSSGGWVVACNHTLYRTRLHSFQSCHSPQHSVLLVQQQHCTDLWNLDGHQCHWRQQPVEQGVFHLTWWSKWPCGLSGTSFKLYWSSKWQCVSLCKTASPRTWSFQQISNGWHNS